MDCDQNQHESDCPQDLLPNSHWINLRTESLGERGNVRWTNGSDAGATSNVLRELAFYAIWPVLAAVTGAFVSAFRRPSPAIRSCLQHFAAGVVFSVVGVELLPDILREHKVMPVVVGFTLGVAP